MNEAQVIVAQVNVEQVNDARHHADSQHYTDAPTVSRQSLVSRS